MKDAYRSFQKKRYNESYVILEQIVSDRPDDPYPYFLLAVVYLFSNKFDRARRIMDTVKSLNRDYPPLAQLEAFLNLKSSTSFESALSFYISSIESCPGDRMIQKAARLLRQAGDFDAFQKNARLQDFVEIKGPPRNINTRSVRRNSPQAGKTGKKRAVPVIVPIIIAGLVMVAAAVAFVFFRKGPEPVRMDTAAVDSVDIAGPGASLINSVNRTKTREFYYSTAKLMDDFNTARSLIKKGQMNKAVVILNRISESNASFMVKEKVNFLVSFIMDNEERSYEGISCELLARDSYLYRGYAVDWTGKVANLKMKPESQSFTLLVDYREGDIFSGTASVFYDRVSPGLENGDMIRLEGIFINTVGSDGRLTVRARHIEKSPGQEKRAGN